jgi:hypothetical protein
MPDPIQDALKKVDLSPVLDDMLKDEDKVKPPEEKGEELDLGQFKNPKDVLKSYKEIQGAFTRTTQENKSVKEENAKLKEQLELANMTANYQAPMPTGNETQDETVKTFNVLRIAEILEEKNDENPSDFQERYAYAQMVARQYPNLSTTPKGVKKLFELGDKLRIEKTRQTAGKALETIFGEPLGEEEIARLKSLVKGGKTSDQPANKQTNAYMPDTSTSTRKGSQLPDQNQNLENDIRQAADQGDIDGTIAALFKKQLAE